MIRAPFILILLLLLTGCGARQHPESKKVEPKAVESKDAAPTGLSDDDEGQHPLYLWEVSGKGHRAWLLGSIHILPAGSEIDQALVDALGQAGSLAVEFDPQAIDPGNTAKFVAEHGWLEPGVTLAMLLGEEDFGRLKRLAVERNIAVDRLINAKPWTVAVMLMMSQSEGPQVEASEQAGSASPNQDKGAPTEKAKPFGIGVDLFLMQLARKDGKEVHSLETLEEQGRALDAMTLDEQIEQLRAAIDSAEKGMDPYAELLESYLAADIREEEWFPGTDAAENDIWESLVDQRNERMTERVISLMEEREDPFVVVGALHVLGPKSLRVLLKKHGYSLRRVTGSGKKVLVRNLDRHSEVTVKDVRVEWPAIPDDFPGGPITGDGSWEVERDRLKYRLTIIKTRDLGLPPRTFYEMNRSVMAQKYKVAEVKGEPVLVGELPGERVWFESPKLVYEARQVLAGGHVYWAVATAEHLPSDKERKKMREFAESISLVVSESREASAAQSP